RWSASRSVAGVAAGGPDRIRTQNTTVAAEEPRGVRRPRARLLRVARDARDDEEPDQEHHGRPAEPQHVAGLPPADPEGGPSDATLLQTLPGVGPYTAGTLLGELGSLTRFTDARALVAYVGFYPVIKESGEHATTPYLSPAGSRIARHALYLAAVNAVRRSTEWRRFYQRKLAQGKKPKQALIAVAVKWLHTAYAMLKHR